MCYACVCSVSTDAVTDSDYCQLFRDDKATAGAAKSGVCSIVCSRQCPIVCLPAVELLTNPLDARWRALTTSVHASCCRKLGSTCHCAGRGGESDSQTVDCLLFALAQVSHDGGGTAGTIVADATGLNNSPPKRTPEQRSTAP